MKIYRVAISGMFGFIQESFFTDLTKAETVYTQIIEEKKKDKDTLSDKECSEEGEQEMNFSEYKVPKINQSIHIKLLKGVFWSFGSESTSENGTEFYTDTNIIVLAEIECQ